MLWAGFSVLLLDMEYSDDYLIPLTRPWTPYYGKQALALFGLRTESLYVGVPLPSQKYELYIQCLCVK